MTHLAGPAVHRAEDNDGAALEGAHRLSCELAQGDVNRARNAPGIQGGAAEDVNTDCARASGWAAGRESQRSSARWREGTCRQRRTQRSAPLSFGRRSPQEHLTSFQT